jgi:hypothetical protein
MAKAAFNLTGNVLTDVKQLSKQLKKIAGVEVVRAHTRVLNAIARKVKTATLRNASKKLKVKNKDLRYMKADGKGERISVFKANASNQKILRSEVKSYGTGIPLSRLNPKQTKSGVRTRAKVAAGAFIATPTAKPVGSVKGRYKKSSKRFDGQTEVFKRITNERYPLRVERLNVAKIISTELKKAANDIVANEAATMLLKEFEYRLMRKIGK